MPARPRSSRAGCTTPWAGSSRDWWRGVPPSARCSKQERRHEGVPDLRRRHRRRAGDPADAAQALPEQGRGVALVSDGGSPAGVARRDQALMPPELIVLWFACAAVTAVHFSRRDWRWIVVLFCICVVAWPGLWA